jgi:hypothetical protein
MKPQISETGSSLRFVSQITLKKSKKAKVKNKFEIRNSKSETNTNYRNSNNQKEIATARKAGLAMT